jgi:hypothetical protein
MFKVHYVILSEDIATSRFSCDLTRCKGACCVVGDAGAPVDESEISVLEKSYKQLSDRLHPDAVKSAEEHGVVRQQLNGTYEINCVDDNACIFVENDERGLATCAIQNAYYRGELNWEKPLSCHLFPIRLKKVAGTEFANFDYIPDTCSAGCENGMKEGIYLAEFLERALKRRYGTEWYDDFLTACHEIRSSELL